MTIDLSFENLDKMGAHAVGPDLVGKSAYIKDIDCWYQAVFEGRGKDKWDIRYVTGQSVYETGRAILNTRNYFWNDPDILLPVDHVNLPLGARFPAAALNIACQVDVRVPFAPAGAQIVLWLDLAREPFYVPLDVVGVTPIALTPPIGGRLLYVSFVAPSGALLDSLTAGQANVSITFVVPEVRNYGPASQTPVTRQGMAERPELEPVIELPPWEGPEGP